MRPDGTMTLGSRQNRENLPPATGSLLSPDVSQMPGSGEVDALPRKVGRVDMHQAIPGSGRKVKVAVVLKVYATAYGRYAVVAQDRTPLCKDCGFINLRHCTVVPLVSSPKSTHRSSSPSNINNNQQCGFQIIPRHCEGEPLQFSVRDTSVLSEWLAVLSPAADTECPVSKSSSPVTIPCPQQSCEEDGGRLSPRRPLSWLQGSSPKLQPAMPCLSEGDEDEEEV